MGRIVASFALTFCLLASTRASWSVTSSRAERGSATGVEHHRVILAESATAEEATLDVALFPAKSATLRVIDNPDAEALAAVMQRENCLAGVNGGYFDPENKPVGLLISDGKVVAPLRKARLLSGVMIVASGRLQLLRLGEYSSERRATAALQCGPFLVDRGQPVPGLNDARAARRTFVFTGSPDHAGIGFCSNLTLAQLGKILAKPGILPGVKVQRALNLDGGSSSAFWFAGEHGLFSISEQKTVRDFVAVVGR